MTVPEARTTIVGLVQDTLDAILEELAAVPYVNDAQKEACRNRLYEMYIVTGLIIVSVNSNADHDAN